MEPLFAFCLFNGTRNKKLEKMYQELNEKNIDKGKWNKELIPKVVLFPLKVLFWFLKGIIQNF